MNIEIKNRFSGEIILCGEYESIKDCIEKNMRADLSRANLSGADLSRADLFGANLSRADLSGANLSRADLFGADLSGANLFGANLSRADLFGADLSGANLFGAYLSRADFNGEKLTKQPLQILGLKYFVMITVEQIKIGCELHKVNEWKGFDDKRIIEMDGKEALAWWREHKDLIFKAHEIHSKQRSLKSAVDQNIMPLYNFSGKNLIQAQMEQVEGLPAEYLTGWWRSGENALVRYSG